MRISARYVATSVYVSESECVCVCLSRPEEHPKNTPYESLSTRFPVLSMFKGCYFVPSSEEG